MIYDMYVYTHFSRYLYAKNLIYIIRKNSILKIYILKLLYKFFLKNKYDKRCQEHAYEQGIERPNYNGHGVQITSLNP